MRNDRYRDLETKIGDYFLYCDSINEGKTKLQKPYTMSGFLCYVGLTMSEFERLSQIKRHKALLESAKAKIEAFIEENALTGSLSCNASLNSLKYYFGWGEKQDKKSESEENDISISLSPEMTSLAR